MRWLTSPPLIEKSYVYIFIYTFFKVYKKSVNQYKKKLKIRNLLQKRFLFLNLKKYQDWQWIYVLHNASVTFIVRLLSILRWLNPPPDWKKLYYCVFNSMLRNERRFTCAVEEWEDWLQWQRSLILPKEEVQNVENEYLRQDVATTLEEGARRTHTGGSKTRTPNQT